MHGRHTDIGDLPKALVDNVREWYRVYKVAEGKPANRYALNGEAVGKVRAARLMRIGLRTPLTISHPRRALAGCCRRRTGLCTRRRGGVPPHVASAPESRARRGDRDERADHIDRPSPLYVL